MDFSDRALPPGLNAEKIQAGMDLAAAKIAERGWDGDLIHKADPSCAIAFNTRPKDTAEAAARWTKGH